MNAHRTIVPAASLDALEPVAFPSGERIASAVADFLHAVDRGDFGRALQIGGIESAYLLALRERLAEHRADRALVADAHRVGRAVADDLYGRIA